MTFTKGHSGNPRGRPRNSIRAALRRIAQEKLPDGSTNAEAVAQKGWEAARAGDLDAIKWVTDQVDGKLPQPTEQTGSLEIVVRRADRNG